MSTFWVSIFHAAGRLASSPTTSSLVVAGIPCYKEDIPRCHPPKISWGFLAISRDEPCTVVLVVIGSPRVSCPPRPTSAHEQRAALKPQPVQDVGHQGGECP